jgi:DNA mismatch endonuclease (patch repair protein)
MERVLREKLVEGKFQGGTPGNTRRMRAIRDQGNKSTERRFRALLIRSGVRGWKVRPSGLAGKPDFHFPKHGLVIFLDGCYWHGCPRCGHVPNQNRPYWSAKIQGNQRRDTRNTEALVSAGFRVLRFWEHELREDPFCCIQRVKDALAGGP